MPDRMQTAGFGGTEEMDWSGEINGGQVISYDDPAALRENAAHVRPAPQTEGAAAARRSRDALEPLPGQGGTVGATRLDQTQLESLLPEATLNMSHGLPASTVGMPQNNEQAYQGSLKAMLSRNIGNYIVATFLVGTQNMVSWEGILYSVGNDYVTIYQVARDRYIVCDMYSLKYMEFYDTRRRALCNRLLEKYGDESLQTDTQNGHMSF